jgi:Family of unknown function (DUF5938)
VIKVLQDFEVEHRHKSHEEREAITDQIGNALVSVEPGRETPEANRMVASVIARGPQGGVEVVIHGSCAYRQTGLLAAETISRILAGRLHKTGFQAAAHAVGARNLITALSERGYFTNTPSVRTI